MFYSILFPAKEQSEQPRQMDAPDCFKDLNLDQVFAPTLKNKGAFELEEFFFTSLNEKETIAYRQDVMRELENDDLRGLFTGFSKTVYTLGKNMESIKQSLASDNPYENNYLARGRMLDCADHYCLEISDLAAGLKDRPLRSSGLIDFTEYISAYSMSEEFAGLCTRVKQLRDELSTVEYCMLIKNGTIRVRKYEGQADHSKQILAVFEKFRQGEVNDYRQKVIDYPYAEHVEAAVLSMAAGLYKDIFSDLNEFCEKYRQFLDTTLTRFAREIQFYLSWHEYIQPLREIGLQFNYPKLCVQAEQLYNFDFFDLALAAKVPKGIVTNDFMLNEPERIIVVTGANQGGKTTFSRAFGQMHWLASLGLCVPGSKSALCLFDNILTHFGKEENLSTLNGKLQDDLERLHGLLGKATSQSVVIINEIFSSTTLSDAITLGGHMMESISSLGAIAMIVTFLDELASYGANTVSMVSMVNEDDPAQRTYKVSRKPPDGLAYAIHIAMKHGLTYEQLNGRLNA